MCGFSGWVLNTKLDTTNIVSSLRSIKHRGPDDTLIFTNDYNQKLTSFSCDLSNEYTQQNFPLLNNNSQKYCFGFNRLSIVDLSNKAMQPFYDEKNQILFMMNGEVYNYNDLRTKHLSDVIFHSESDSEVAFMLYQKMGNAFVDLLQGMFAIVIYDFKAGILKVYRDRLGIKPFYYSITNEGLYFSSEMKGLFAMNLKKELNYTGLAYSMYLVTCPSPLTIYDQIHSLQAGHYLEFNVATNQLKSNSYWHLEYTENKQKINSSQFYSDISQVCKLYSTGEVPKAIMLSGGLDSGFLAYVYGKLNEKIEGVHIFSDDPDSEYEYAQLNAQNAGIPIANYAVSKNFRDDQIEFFLRTEEEPNTGPESALFLCDKLKNNDTKIIYSALGPDEIFGGYAYYQMAKKLSKYRFLIPILPSFIFPEAKKIKLKEIKQFGIEASPFVFRQLFSWSEICTFLTQNNQPIPKHPILFLQNQVSNIYPDFSTIPLLKKISYYDLFYYIASHHSFRSDQPSMHFSLEMRFPFLEHTFIEKYFNQSNTFNEIAKTNKPAFRAFIKQFIPKKVFNMPKKGFTISPIDSKNGRSVNSNKKWYMAMLSRITNDINAQSTK
ncbi:MAG: asparagine synthase (glutamine-hydrolyzing) [Paludibacter sp.]|nr:asparagine synthase (glutamine-hydrolyzing) [Paludibacter sp.]